MRNANTILSIHQKRGSEGLPLERVYKHLFNPEFYLRAYGKIYRNTGAMTPGSTKETVDGMDLQRIHNVIGFLRMERYEWTPVRRTEIPKANGKTRPLGIPTWSDKLLQEVLRSLLEPYYEQKFSDRSHGFRPNRGCHSALREVQGRWTGTIWFIEGDIKGCFDNIDHDVLLEIIRRDIHDGRLVKLIDGLLKAGYMKDWRRHETLSGTPQGGIISPLLANIYLNELDRFVEGTLLTAYTKGGAKRKADPNYMRNIRHSRIARERNDLEEVKRLKHERRKMASLDMFDPEYRRLRYVRYADDFLLGFAGPKKEAEEIRQRLGEFLGQRLKLSLSMEKTVITHAGDDKAKFLGYEIKASRSKTGGRKTVNGHIALLMPAEVVRKYRDRFSREGKVRHRTELLAETDYTILQRYHSVLQGIYNYYCMAVNVGNKRRMGQIRYILETSLTKTLANKHKCSVREVYKRYEVRGLDRKMLRAVIERPGREPLIATFGGIPHVRIPQGMGVRDFQCTAAWHSKRTGRAEVVQRLLANGCELCGVEGVSLEAHHIRKMADIDRPGRRPKAEWEKRMLAIKRKTLMICDGCHDDIHAGRYDGPRV